MFAAIRKSRQSPGISPSNRRGFTLIEIMIVLAIIAILATVGIGQYQSALETARYLKITETMRRMQTDIDTYFLMNGKYPTTLDEVGHGYRVDQWGNPYQYLNIAETKGKGKVRKDKNLVPINTDYDLYSMGPNGQSVPPLTSKLSRDDIIRANDGEYIGLASKY